MTKSLELSILRVYNPSQQVIGTAFLVDDTRVLTCAHVVNDALGLARNSTISEQATVKLDFPLLHEKKSCFARVVYFDTEKDIAGLELTSDPPHGAQPVRLAISDAELWEHGFRAFGFSMPEGAWASGVLRGKNAEGWIQIDTKSVGYSVQPGFSGAPVWDEELEAVVGMIVAADRNVNVKAAFCIPSPLLVQWDALRNRVKSAGEKGRVFLSYKRYAQPDQQVMEFLDGELTKMGYVVFTDLEIRKGENWLNRIDEEISRSDFLVVLLSERSADSEMVQSEIYRAYEYRKKNGHPQVLPIRVSYKEMLPYGISAFLNPLQYVAWNGASDNPRVIQELLQAMQGQLPAQEPALALITPVHENELAKPTPVFDPRILDELQTPGGTVRLQDKFYVERAEDRRFRNEVKRRDGTTVTIRAARQSGKSSLLVRGMQQAKEAGAKNILLDMQRVGKDHLATSDIFMRYFAEYVMFKLSSDTDVIDKYWRRSISPQEKLTSLIEDRLLEDMEENLFLGMDEIDRLLETGWHDEFFGLLRSWHNLRATDERWQKLSTLMVISTEPYLLIGDANQSPFNVGTNLYLQDFNAEQVRDLNQRHGNPVNDVALEELTRFFGGHPYLTRKAFYLLVTEPMTWQKLVETSTDELGPFGDHLRRYHWMIQQDPALKTALKNIIKNNSCDDELMHRLLQAGLVKASGDYASCRCDMYRQYFEEKL